VVLLDEPFSALDAPVRAELRRELRRLQREVNLSTVLVTHDPEEAAMLADEIMVVSDGQVLQSGSCRDVYQRPASVEIGRLLGIDNLVCRPALGCCGRCRPKPFRSGRDRRRRAATGRPSTSAPGG
jgi:ABC-type sulfate/molybdate transport systems ATPase subunit